MTLFVGVVVLMLLVALGVWVHTRLDARFGYSRRSKDLDFNLKRILAGTDAYGHAGYDSGQLYALACDRPGFKGQRHLRIDEFDAAVKRLTRRKAIYESGFRRLALVPRRRSV